MKKFSAMFLATLVLLTGVGVQSATADTQGISIPFKGIIREMSIPYVLASGEVGTYTIVTPAFFACPLIKTIDSFCDLPIFEYVDKPGHSDEEFDWSGATSDNFWAQRFAPTLNSEGKLSTIKVWALFQKTWTLSLRVHGSVLVVNVNRPFPKGTKDLTTKQFKSPCKTLNSYAPYGKAIVRCETYGSKQKWATKKDWPMPLPVSAPWFCGIGAGDVGGSFQNGDGGRTLILSGVSFKYGDPVYFDCLMQMLAVPVYVQTQIFQTRALDGRQNATWGIMSASWTYHPDAGLNIIFTRKWTL